MSQAYQRQATQCLVETSHRATELQSKAERNQPLATNLHLVLVLHPTNSERNNQEKTAAEKCYRTSQRKKAKYLC